MFFRDGCVIGLSGIFQSPCFPLGISVEDHVLEMAGFDSRLGLIMGDFPEIAFCGETVLGFRFGVGLCRRLGGRFWFRLGSRLPFGFRGSLGLGWGRL